MQVQMYSEPLEETYVLNKIIVIVGASSGIGEATAVRLAGEGNHVVVAGRRADKLAKVTDQIDSLGGRATALPVDVTDQVAVAGLVNAVVSEFGRLDVLVECAGVMPLSPLSALMLEEWERMIDVNIRGLLYSIAAVLPHFQRQGNGHFITIASTAAREVLPAAAVYSATKSAASTITEGLRLESDPEIRVTTISPGVTETELLSSIGDPAARDLSRAVWDKIAMSPDAVAAAISYAIGQPDDVDVNEIVVRPARQRYGWLAP
jgi:NADP-dependent 3-hydroxy acid dehydrogenase YdfG